MQRQKTGQFFYLVPYIQALLYRATNYYSTLTKKIRRSKTREKKDKQKEWLFKYPEINMAELFSSVRLTTIIQSPCKQTLFGRNNTYVKGSLWLSSSIFYISMSLHEFLIRLSLSGIFPLRILRIIQRPKLRNCLVFSASLVKSFFLICTRVIM